MDPKQMKRKLEAKNLIDRTWEEYLTEAEHQDGNEVWLANYGSAFDVAQDFGLYLSNMEHPNVEPLD